MNSKEKSNNSYLQLGLVAVLIGSIGTVLFTTEKGKKVLKSLEEMGDDFVVVVENVLLKFDKNLYPTEQAKFEAFSALVMTTINELKDLRKKSDVADKVISKPVKQLISGKKNDLEKKVENVKKDLEVVEGEVQNDDELEGKISWLQRRAKRLSKKY